MTKLTDKELDDLSEEFAEMYYGPYVIDYDEDEPDPVYYLLSEGEGGDERLEIDAKFYPIIDRYL